MFIVRQVVLSDISQTTKMDKKRILLWVLIAAVAYGLGYLTYSLFFKPDYSSVQGQPAPGVK